MTQTDFSTSANELDSELSTEDFIITLFCKVDDFCLSDKELRWEVKHPQGKLHPSEIITLGMLYALKGGGQRAFYRWLKRDYAHLFPCLPERTRLFRSLNTHHLWCERFRAQPTVLGVCDSYGIELIHPIREGRSPKQLGKKGKSNHRWIVGVKFAPLLNQWGLIVDWDWNTANVHDSAFLPLIQQFEERMIVLADSNFHAAKGDPSNLKIAPRGQWNERMIIETFNSMVQHVCHLKHASQRVGRYLGARLAYTVALFNTLKLWDGLNFDEHGVLHTSIARFAL